MDKLISFETAILAKEKGFNEVCLNNYALDGNSYDRKPVGLSAPTQSLLQDWLREKHNIYIVILPTINMCWAFKIINIGNENIELPPYDGVDAYDYSVYEEALEAGLFEGLKLIKI